MTDKCFYFEDGKIISDVFGLLDVLKNMDDETFYNHVNDDKNDFSVWIKQSLNREQLAAEISKAKSKKEAIDILKKYNSGEKLSILSPIRKIFYSSLNMFQSIKSELLYNFRYKNLSDTFISGYKQRKNKINELKDNGYEIQMCESYIEKLEKKIEKFIHNRSEKSAISILHLFYCLDEELVNYEKTFNIVKTFNNNYDQYKIRIKGLKKKNKDVYDPEMTLSRIRKMIKIYTESNKEQDAIEIVHLFYSLEDAIDLINKK
ncbi:hypothetical protein GF327_06580 [Candidatus Woesearchaeota archaeon]|nr:hypothetical protein [Candidatus Woesearchaeota archaeon]